MESICLLNWNTKNEDIYHGLKADKPLSYYPLLSYKNIAIVNDHKMYVVQNFISE